MIHIEKPVIEQAESLVDTHLRAWRQTYSDYFTEETFQSRENNREAFVLHAKNLIESRNPYLVLMDDFQIVGLVVYQTYKNMINLDAIYLLKEYQSHGYGTMLLNRVLQEIHLSGSYFVEANCFKGIRANEFFLNYGFEFVKQSYVTVHHKDYLENLYRLRVGESYE